ncbi:MAG: histidine phosphatase family protein [Flavobacteriales bacterium]|nr:histidine phosphatase family protein [Flavobacteriales bacterium]
MKTLYFNRHAKSDWSDHTLSDFDRPLNKRGLRDAPNMAERLLKRKERIDVFISSPANRAISTARIMANGFGYTSKEIVQVERLYLPSIKDFLVSIGEISEGFSSAILFAHNPGITDVVEYLTNEYVGNVPTCGIIKISFAQAGRWNEISAGTGSLEFFDYPKKEFGQ